MYFCPYFFLKSKNAGVPEWPNGLDSKKKAKLRSQ